MQIERISAGTYRVTDGERTVSLIKGLDRKWTVTGGEGVGDVPPKRVASYTDAKRAAEGILIGTVGEAGGTGRRPKASASGQPPSARVAEAVGMPSKKLAAWLMAMAVELDNQG